MHRSASSAERIGYDAAGEVTSVSYSDGVTPNVTFAYDADGRKLAMTDGTGTTSWTYDAFGDMTSQVQGSGAAVLYGYDSAGNQTSISYPGQTTAVLQGFDKANRLSSVTDPARNKTSFGYDADSKLLTTTYPDGVTVTNGYDNVGNLASIKAVDGSATLVPEALTRDGAGLYGPGGTAIEQIGASASYWFVHDQVGSTLALLSATGTVVGSYSYTPYGVATFSGTATTPLQYTGQYTDSVSGLVYLRARYYDPHTALFITVDPDLGQTGLPYAYTGDSPLTYTDLLGLCGGFFGFVCSTATFVANHAGDIGSALGTIALGVVVVAAVTTCVLCDLAIAGLSIASAGFSAFQTGEDIGEHNYTQAALDGVSTILGAFGFSDDFGAALLEGGEGVHVLEDEAGPLLESAGRKFDVGALGSGLLGVLNEHGVLGHLGEGTAC